MKKRYTSLEIQLILCEKEDVIRTSALVNVKEIWGVVPNQWGYNYDDYDNYD